MIPFMLYVFWHKYQTNKAKIDPGNTIIIPGVYRYYNRLHKKKRRHKPKKDGGKDGKTG